MEIQTRTDKGRVRPVNEDAVSAFSLEGYEVILLADGLGGHRAGEIASGMVIDAMQAHLTRYGLTDVQDALRTAAQYANEQIYEKQKEAQELAGMGSTLVAAVIGPQEIHIAHAGDSRAYIANASGLVQLTRDHSVSNDLGGSGRDMNESLKHMLTRAMGTEPQIQVDYLKFEPEADTILLLCSDGLSNEVETEQILQILHANLSLSERADALLHAANENGGKDNITLALWERKGAAV